VPIPQQQFTIVDPGLGITEPATSTPLCLGTCASGVVSTLYSFSTQSDAVDTLGQGPLTETVCQCLSQAGGPVLAMPVTGSVAGAAGAVTNVPVGAGTGTVTVAGTPLDAYEVIVECTATGTVGTGQFRYSLDDGNTYSSSYVIPSGTTFVIPGTGLTITFVVGAGPVFWQTGDVSWFDCTAPQFAAADLTAAITAIRATTATFDFLVLSGTYATAAAAVTVFGALETGMDNLEGDYRFIRAMMDAGTGTAAAAATAWSAVSHNRISVGFGTCDISTAKPLAGWGAPSRPIVDAMAATAAKSLISTDLGRVASGSLTGVTAISHDEYLSETLDAERLTTTRTWIGRPGFYFTNVRIKSDPGSDYLYWQFGRVMDVASATTYLAQQLFISIGVRTNSDGTIDERDAQRLETRVMEPLRNQLTQPSNAEGTQGHVSELAYAIDRTNNLQTSQTLLSEVSVRPLGYPKFINTTLGFKLNV
jgi:hypothetical protein